MKGFRQRSELFSKLPYREMVLASPVRISVPLHNWNVLWVQ